MVVANDAAAVLEAYYSAIEAGRYDRAFALRSVEGTGPTGEQFAASFAAYADYRASLDTPSEPVVAGGSLYVEIPVQITGRLKTGKPFASAGIVTLTRPVAGGRWLVTR